MATGIERDWIVPTIFEVDHVFDESTGCVRASRVGRYGEIPLRAAPVAPEPERQAALLAAAALRRGPSERDVQLLRRLAFAGKPTSFEALVEQASRGATGLNDMDLGAHVDPEARRAADRAAPLDLPLPSGRRARLAYRDDGRVVAAVKLQELFGLAETPRLGPHRTPVTFELLAPNGRPVQVTSDLASFWTTGYQTVRKALRARYPKHPWPDDPWTATPTHRTTKATRR